MRLNLITLLLSISFTFLSHLSYSQSTIQVLDASNLQPIIFVTVIEQETNRVLLTDKNGEISFSELKKNTSYTFRHPTYKNIELSYKQVVELKYKILLFEDVININEVVVSASKWEQDKSEVANSILSISAKEVEFRNPQTAADILESSGQVFVQKSQMGGGSPKIRGFSANSVLIILDGVRMNNAIFRSGNLQSVILIDPNMVESSEVVFGPGSVIYGSDALGGVMDFRTVMPKFSFGDDMEISGAVLTRYSTANHEKTGHIQLNIGNKKLSSLTGISYSNFDDLRTGANRSSNFPDFGKRLEYIKRVNGQDVVIQNKDVNLQVNSAYNQINLLQKLSYRINAASNLIYSFYHTTSSNIPRYDRLTFRDDDTKLLKNAEWYYGPQKFSMNSLAYSNFSKTRYYNGAKIIFAYQSVEESRYERIYQDDELFSTIDKVKIYSLNMDFDKKLNERNEFFYGFEYLLNKVKSEGFKENILSRELSSYITRYPDGGSDYRSFAFYTRYKRNVSKKLISTVGLRYTNIEIGASFKDMSILNFPFDEIALKNSAISGSLGLVYNLSNKLKLSTVFSTGFRSPNIDDVGKVFKSVSGKRLIVPNENLKPEFSYNGEFVVSANINDKVQIESSLYYSLLTDAIVRRDFAFNGDSSIVFNGALTKVEALVNVGEAYILGFSLALKAQLSNSFLITSSINYNDGEDKIDHVPLRHTTPIFGQTSLSYKKQKLKTELFVKYNGARTIENFSPSELIKPHLYTSEGTLAWTTFNIRALYQLTNKLSTSLALENLTDLHYRPYSSGISAAGRNIIVSLRGKF